MKTDYTITPEYLDALLTDRYVRSVDWQRKVFCEGWEAAYNEARRSHEAGEPLIRTVCKIAARILFVLLLVGMGVGVMLK